MTQIDLSIFDNEPEALAKITQAISKVYFDNCLKRGYNIDPVSEAYSVAFRLCPNYRIILQKKVISFPKYDTLIPQIAEITSLPINTFSHE
jgi:hypothetical protein